MTGLLGVLWVVVVLIAVAIGVTGVVLSRTVAARLRKRGASPAEVRGARVVISLVGVTVALAVLFVALGPLPVVSGLTLSAAVGLAATLALQTTISNVIAGFILLRDRVLRLNDNVQIGGVSGKVVRIGLVTTWLRTEDGSLVSVSNSNLLSGPLMNHSVGDRLQGEF